MFLKGHNRQQTQVEAFEAAVEKNLKSLSPAPNAVDKLYKRLEHSTLADVTDDSKLWETVKAYGEKFEATRDATFKGKPYQEGSLFKLIKVARASLWMD